MKLSKGQRVREIGTGWMGIVTMAGAPIAQVRFGSVTAAGMKLWRGRSFGSA